MEFDVVGTVTKINLQTDIDGSYHQVIVNESKKMDEQRGVAVDPLKGYLFWANWGGQSHIGRAAMDGSNQQHIVVNDVAWPN